MVSDRIFFGGFASGLDTVAIIDALIQVARRPILLAELRLATEQNRQSTLTQIATSLSNLWSQLDDLQDTSIVNSRLSSVTSDTDNAGRVIATVDSSAALGSFTVAVIALATATKVVSGISIGAEIDATVKLDDAGFAIPPTAGTFTIAGTEFTIDPDVASTAESASAVGSGVDREATLENALLTIVPDASGTFTINGVQLTYDATIDSIDDVILRITQSSAGVTASYDDIAEQLLLTADDTGPALITYADDTGNFLETMNFVDGVATPIAVEIAGADLPSLNDVIAMINDPIDGFGAGFATLVNDSDGRLNLLRLNGDVQVGSGADTSNFLAMTYLLESEPGGGTRTSVRNLGTLAASVNLEDASLEISLTPAQGTFTINGVDFSYDATTDSFNNVISRINNSSAGVTVTHDSYKDRVSIVADGTGSTAISLTDVTGNFLAASGLLAGTETLGTNAEYSINGGSTQYANSNTVTDAVAGVTLTLKEVTTASVTVEVIPDNNLIKSRIESFVGQYNSTITLIRDATKFVEDGRNGALFADFGMRNLDRTLRSLVTGPATGLSGEITSLSAIGLNFGTVGSTVGTTDTLSFDGGVFDDAVQNDQDAVRKLLAGFATSVSSPVGIGTVISATGTPTAITDSGTYEISTTNTGDVTVTFTPDNGATPMVRTGTVSPSEVNTTLIPGVTLTFNSTLTTGIDTITVTATEEGVAKALYDFVGSLSRSGGIMEARETEATARIEDINDQIDRLEERIDRRREQLIRKFTQMELSLQRLQSQQAALNNLVAQLSANRGAS